MKRCYKRWLFMLFVCMFCFTYMTETLAESKEKNSEGKTVRVGYFDYAGFIEKDADGKFTGYGVEYLNEISRYTGWSYDYVYGNWSECLERLENGEIDLLCTAQYTEERARKYDYCDYSSGLEYTVLYASKENEDIYFEDYEHLNGKRVGMMKNSYQNEEFDEFQKEHNLNMETVSFDTNMKMEDALRVGVVDVIVSGSLDVSEEFKLIAKVGISPFYFITQKGDTAFLHELNDAMRKLQMDYPFLNGHLYEKYYGKPVNTMVGQTREEAEWIKTAPILTVSCVKNNFPLGYIDEDTGEAAGFYPELMRKIAEYAGIEIEFVAADSGSGAIRMVTQGQADLTLAIYGSEAVRKEYGINYSDSYVNAEISAVAKRGSAVENKTEIKVAVPDGYASYTYYLQEKHPNWGIQTYNSITRCMEAVNEGAADIALADTLYLQASSEPNIQEDLVIISGMESKIPMSVGIGENQPEELNAVLTKAILRLTENDIKDARIKCTVGNDTKFDFITWLKSNYLIILGIIGVCIVITMIVLQRKETYYRKLAMTDELTGVWNRNKFIKEAGRILNNNKNKEYYLISTDVDKFKYINDTFGYSTGDEVLKEEARQFARIFDERGCFARIVADEFAGLLECSEDDPEEKELSERLHTFEQNMRNYSNQYFHIQIKMGLYWIEKRDSDVTITECIDRANIAKKQIKGNLNQVVAYFDNETAKRSAFENRIEGKMEKALEDKGFCVYYQPKYDLKTGQLESAEALVRWIDPEEGMIGPNLFIPLFEKNGFIIRLDFYVYEEVCKHLKKWMEEGKKIVPISVNVSRAHLATPNFIPDLLTLLKKYEIPIELIELELTESAFSEDEEALKKMVASLKNMGFRITIDDFGSGFSSMNLLKQIPADVLKIDKAFLEEVETSAKSKIIITQVVSMAKKINMHTVCEGVETEKQADFLREIHCEVAQGFLFSKPVSAEEFESKITGQNQ